MATGQPRGGAGGKAGRVAGTVDGEARQRGQPSAPDSGSARRRTCPSSCTCALRAACAACGGAAPGFVQRRCLQRLTTACGGRRAAPRPCMRSGDRMAVDPVSSMLAGVTNSASQQADYPPAVSLSPDGRVARARGRKRAATTSVAESARPRTGLIRTRGRSCVSRLSTSC